MFFAPHGTAGDLHSAKVREGDKRIVWVKEGEIKNRHVFFIIDDLVKTGTPQARLPQPRVLKLTGRVSIVPSGGTLIECKNGLYRLGAAKVSAFITHAVFPLDSWKRFTEVQIVQPCPPHQSLASCKISNRPDGLPRAHVCIAQGIGAALPPLLHHQLLPRDRGYHQGQEAFEVLSLAQSISDNVFKY